jgi:hypothetical protein
MTAKLPRSRRKPVDPLDVLRQVAGDESASSVVRCRAARALLAAECKRAPLGAQPQAADDTDPITRRALELAAARNSRSVN